MDSLKQMSISNCVVIRGDYESEVPTSDLVPETWFDLNKASTYRRMFACFGPNNARWMNLR